MDKILQELQDDFALIDLLTKKGKSGLMEILIKQFLPIEFRIEQDPNHKNSPHIHINYGRQKHVASYSLISGVRFEGNLDRKYDKSVKDWIEKNNAILIQIYNDIQNGNEKSYSMLIRQL